MGNLGSKSCRFLILSLMLPFLEFYLAKICTKSSFFKTRIWYIIVLTEHFLQGNVPYRKSGLMQKSPFIFMSWRISSFNEVNYCPLYYLYKKAFHSLEPLKITLCVKCKFSRCKNFLVMPLRVPKLLLKDFWYFFAALEAATAMVTRRAIMSHEWIHFAISSWAQLPQL